MRHLRMTSMPVLVSICMAVAVVGWPVAAVADTIADPTLPPTAGQYVSIGDWHATYENYGVQLDNPIHDAFTGVIRDDFGTFERETFQSRLRADTNLGPVTLTGSVTTHVFGYASGAVGTFATEIVSMSLSGSAGGMFLEIRESPGIQSVGSTTITNLGGGMYDIDSFFDVWTELRVNGAAWDPGLVPTGTPRMEWEIPEPATFALFALGGLFAARRRRS